ncbi:MAG: hypothetical protein RLP44_08730 [Aggregatilineales bacterium]
MSQIETVHFILPISFLWWLLYFTRLYNVVSNSNIFKMPRFYLWLMVFNMGIIYYLHNYKLEAQLQSYFVDTGLPVVTITKVLLSSGFITYGYLVVIRKYTRFDIPKTIDGIMIAYLMLMIVFCVVGYQRLPYLQVQIISNGLVSFANLSAAFSLVPMTRQLLHEQKTEVREAHHLWFILFMLSSSLAATLFLVDGVVKLLTNWRVIDTHLYVAAEISRTTYMLSLGVLIGPDRYLYWIHYPARLRTYFKLKQLADTLYKRINLTTPYNIPQPRIFTFASAELANYRLLIAILDAFYLLPHESELYQQVYHISQLNLSYRETVQEFVRLVENGVHNK